MLSNGDKIGPYIIRERAGQGGMATVYKAWHEGLHRFEALKVPRGAEQGAHDSAYIQRLLSEARVAAGLHHPHIVAIHGVSEPLAPIPFFAMDWVQGRDLAKILAEKRAFSLCETIPILESVASALDYAHACGVVHRDIKPANILIADSGGVLVPQVVDFGISRAAEDEDGAGETKLTKSGMIVGTPEYMSPEQAGSGAPVDFRTDLYSLAVVAYEMLCGAPPFTAGSGVSRFSVLISHVRDSAPLFEKCPDFPRQAGEVLLRALSKTPDERPSSCSAFIEELRQAAQNAPVFSRAIVEKPNAQEEERTPFDSSRFERDEAATVFERPLSVSAAPRTVVPQKNGAATLENASDSVYSLRARLEAASAKVVSPAELNLPPIVNSPLKTAAIAASIPPGIAAIPQKIRESVPSQPSQSLNTATRGTSRVALLAGLGGILVGGALVLMMIGRDYGTPAKANSGTSETMAASAPRSNRAETQALPALNYEKLVSVRVSKTSDLAAPIVPAPLDSARLRTMKVIRTREIAYATQTRRSDKRAAGSRSVVQRGQNGAREVELQISYRGEKEVGRIPVAKRVIRPAVAQIVVIGTRAAPQPRELFSPQKTEASAPRARIRSARQAMRRSIAPRLEKVQLAAKTRVRPQVRPQAASRLLKIVRRSAPVSKKRRLVREAPLPP
ncbi:Serine/threonine protein kinase [Abditibacterium utsteinense]|uniref:Serine/threonine protein kinase n=1 Tax=Abditibacterium utsteinense TaxID=1960156 RepID=A0A2S8SW02_9BACT|nr:protein kinase [Abditibacterium utsteinense]PQV64973.1 Serine/threonine protein kinase [Abditibacterium utsteinense]